MSQVIVDIPDGLQELLDDVKEIVYGVFHESVDYDRGPDIVLQYIVMLLLRTAISGSSTKDPVGALKQCVDTAMAQIKSEGN